MTTLDHPNELDLQPGELVRVRSAQEIFDTLDNRGKLENLPFMPEMMQYCGRTFSVFKRADKTCGPDHGLRRMHHTVHLSNVRCDGTAHGSCEAACLLWWKEAWLERVPAYDVPKQQELSADEEAFVADTLLPATTAGSSSRADDQTWRCQATDIPHASTQLHGWHFDQYPRDARNWGLRKVLRTMIIDVLNRMQVVSRRHLPKFLLFRGGQTYPFITGPLEKGKTPSARLDLQPGDVVRIKSKAEIERTLDRTNRNRGLTFDPEMVQYCGRTARVRARVRRLINEETGKMLNIHTDCIILEGVTCTADYHRLCPRGIFPYWREIWLEKIG
jgi:hypothetical protein